MTFEKKIWYNNGIVPDDAPEGTVAPTMSADNLNRIEEGIYQNSIKVDYSKVLDLLFTNDEYPSDTPLVFDILPEIVTLNENFSYGCVLKDFVLDDTYSFLLIPVDGESNPQLIFNNKIYLGTWYINDASYQVSTKGCAIHMHAINEDGKTRVIIFLTSSEIQFATNMYYPCAKANTSVFNAPVLNYGAILCTLCNGKIEV